jgi:hypothetical protein
VDRALQEEIAHRPAHEPVRHVQPFRFPADDPPRPFRESNRPQGDPPRWGQPPVCSPSGLLSADG